jgi:uracil-DNA glycosylase family 4
MTLFNYRELESLAGCAAECEVCLRMQHRSRVLGPQNGSLDSRVMFIAEAPGRLGADRTGIPLSGDKTGDNFEHLLKSIGWLREQVFITNAVLCNPRDDAGLNDTPTLEEIRNCSAFLNSTIQLIDPLYIITLGGSALTALSYIVPHSFELKRHVRQLLRWNGRNLIPLYHTGPRAVARHSLLNMESDFQKVREVIGNPLSPKAPVFEKPLCTRPPTAPKLPGLIEAIALLVERLQPISLFRLHKLLYLAESECREIFGRPFLGAYFIRQKDGPFAPEITRAITFLRTELLGETRTCDGMAYWCRSKAPPSKLSAEQREILDSIVRKYGRLTNRGVKIAAYRHGPMVNFVAMQKAGAATYNRALFPAAERTSDSASGGEQRLL